MQLKARRRNVCRQNLSNQLVDHLESRVLMDGADLAADLFHGNPNVVLNGAVAPALTVAGGALAGGVSYAASATIAVSQLPKWHSRASATAKIFLDFNGAGSMTWGQFSAPAQSAYSSDGDTSTFSVTEQNDIYEIWQRVAEKYSPFNIDVTVEDPGNRSALQTVAVVMASDTGTWLGGAYGGMAYIGSFASGYASNTAYVFPKNLGPYGAMYIGEAAAHEAGHTFGLNHQSQYSGNTKIADYYQGDAARAPVMGDSYYAQRGLWWYGQTTSATTYQDDLAVLSNTTNRFGYRTDDHSNTVNAGDALNLAGSAVSGGGVIERTTDRDAFSFTTGAGGVNFTVSPAAYGAMLDLKLDLYNSAGALVSSVNGAVFTESLSATLAAGSYTLVVSSNGGYGDVGQYTISGSIVPSTTQSLAAPTGLTVVNTGGQVQVAWSDGNAQETGVVVQRSVNGGAFADYASLGAFTTSFVDGGTAAGNSYSYRVYAVNDGSVSGASNSAGVTLAPDAPASLSAGAVSTSAIALAWSDVNGETGYRIERSTDGSNFSLVTTVGAGVLNYTNSGLTASTTYYYRVVATNAGGSSLASVVASATTSAAPAVTLNAPGSVSAVSQKNGRLKISWRDTNSAETGYVVEQSTDGVNFSVVANLAANTTSWQTGRLTTGRSYWFRMKAVAGSASSAYSAVAQANAGSTSGSLTVGSSADSPSQGFGRKLILGLAKLPILRK